MLHFWQNRALQWQPPLSLRRVTIAATIFILQVRGVASLTFQGGSEIFDVKKQQMNRQKL